MKLNIDIAENKVLKLHQVLKKELTEKESKELLKTLRLFQAFVSAMGLVPRGPLIVLAKPITNDGVTSIQNSIMTQLIQKPNSKLGCPYSYREEIRVENCLYCRFNDKQDYLPIAYSKINVYAYENSIDLLGDTYTVYIANDEGVLMCDIFAEIRHER